MVTFRYYAVANKCVASQWPVQFLEEDLDNTGSRKGFICSLLSLFQMFEDKPVSGAVFCSQERTESILAEQDHLFFKE